MENNKVKLGFYKHFKGGIYKVVGFGKNSETLEMMVIYYHLGHESDLWVRPISMWNEIVIDKEGNYVPRFSYIDNL